MTIKLSEFVQKIQLKINEFDYLETIRSTLVEKYKAS